MRGYSSVSMIAAAARRTSMLTVGIEATPMARPLLDQLNPSRRMPTSSLRNCRSVTRVPSALSRLDPQIAQLREYAVTDELYTWEGEWK